MTDRQYERPLMPDEFARLVKKALREHSDDGEKAHAATDRLMEDVLCALGYEKGVALIRKSTRHCA